MDKGNFENAEAVLKSRLCNLGSGPNFLPVDIGDGKYSVIIQPQTAFWALIENRYLPEILSDKKFINLYLKKEEEFKKEMKALRFSISPQAVYFNPTQRCNLNCKYCYIPEEKRRNGIQMKKEKIFETLIILKSYFEKILPEGVMPHIVFHGAEPMLNRDAIFSSIVKFKNDFKFGIQTNATLLDNEAIDFLISNEVGLGISIDGHTEGVANTTRKTWSGKGTFKKVVEVIEKLNGYKGLNIIATITKKNVKYLCQIVEFFHKLRVPSCMLNVVRCTLPNARLLKSEDLVTSRYFISAIKKTYELYQKTKRKLIVANFADVLVSILAPSARKLMCNISPCGGGRLFFSIDANGNIFPCSEFIGIPEFKAGNIFNDKIEDILKSRQFKIVTERKTENIKPCFCCAFQNFCGAPCPAEAHQLNGNICTIGSFCEFYIEQIRYAFRIIADRKEEAFLWDDWDKDTKIMFQI